MKISVDDQELFTLTPTQKQVIQNDIPLEDFDADMKRRLRWVLLDVKYAKCMERMRKEWEPKLKARGVQMFPTDDDQFAQLVFSQPDYKNASVKMAEQQAANDLMNLINGGS